MTDGPDSTRSGVSPGISEDMGHVPVLGGAILELLAPKPGEVAVDCTAGRGGHATQIAQRIGSSGTLILIDADSENLAYAKDRVLREWGEESPQLLGWHANFVETARRMAVEGLQADLLLADLGFASNQMSDPDRGLSFSRDGALDMRFNPAGGGRTAADLVNTLSEQELAEILRDFGEEREARRIAAKIVRERGNTPIKTTSQLAIIVRQVLGPRGGGPRIDPATRTFQALRIAVNDELGCLRSLLEAVSRCAAGIGSGATGWLRPGARVGIISFHSLEDREVKRAFGELEKRGLGELLTRKPVEADERERHENPRARSARLRVIRLTDYR